MHGQGGLYEDDVMYDYGAKCGSEGLVYLKYGSLVWVARACMAGLCGWR